MEMEVNKNKPDRMMWNNQGKALTWYIVFQFAASIVLMLVYLIFKAIQQGNTDILVDEMVNDEVHYITIYTDDEKLINKYMSLYDGKKIQLSYKEDINKLIQELSKYKIKKLLIEEASLEDIFMLYYK